MIVMKHFAIEQHILAVKTYYEYGESCENCAKIVQELMESWVEIMCVTSHWPGRLIKKFEKTRFG